MCICKLCTLFVLICLDGAHQAALGDVYFQFDLGFVRIRQDRCVFWVDVLDASRSSQVVELIVSRRIFHGWMQHNSAIVMHCLI